MSPLVPGRYISRLLPLDRCGVAVQLDVWFTGRTVDTVLMAYPVNETPADGITRPDRSATQRLILDSRPMSKFRRERFVTHAANQLCALEGGEFDDQIMGLIEEVSA